MKPEKNLRINSRVEVALADEDQQIFGHSLIQEVNEDSFSIMIPLIDGHTLYLAAGDEVVVSILINDRRYVFQTRVLEKQRESRLVVLKMPQILIPADRRGSVRTKALLPVKYDVLGSIEPENWDNITPAQEAVITDLSGKGLVLSIRSELEKGTLLVLDLNAESETIHVKAKLLAEVVRCEQNDYSYQIAVKFLHISQRQEDLIIKYVFHCLRKSIQLKRDDY